MTISGRAFPLSRRAALAGAACLALPPPVHAADWTFDAYARAMQASGRATDLTAQTFAAMRQRRGHALQQLETWLRGELGTAAPTVMRAIAALPREYFHYDYAAGRSFARDAYDWYPRAWPIGHGSTLSALNVQAYMTQLVQPQPHETALEIGTGSGYQAALLSHLARKTCTIEIIAPLGAAVGRIFGPLGLDNVETRVGDGYDGWPQERDGFDIIVVTCAAQAVPPPLLRQLRPGSGRLVIPVGPAFRSEQFLYLFTKEGDGRVRSRRDIGVWFVPMTGRIAGG